MPETSIGAKIAIASLRIFYLVFCGIGAVAVPEARKLLITDYSMSGSTIRVPLELCRPNSIQVDGQTISVDASEGVKKCITLSVLVNACACSIVLSIMAVLGFVLVDGYVRMKKTHKHKGMVTGMGILLCFIVLQTAFATGALARQATFYQQLFNDLFDAADDERDAKVHGSLTVLWVAFVASALACILMCCEILYKFCCGSNQELGFVDSAKYEREFRASVAKADPSVAPNKTTSVTDFEDSMEPTTPVESSNPISWTSV